MLRRRKDSVKAAAGGATCRDRRRPSHVLTSATHRDQRVDVSERRPVATCTDNAQSRPDDVYYLQWMHGASDAAYFDVLGAHGAGYGSTKRHARRVGRATTAAGGCISHRVEHWRAVMERNGDTAKQAWLLEFGSTPDCMHPAHAWHVVTTEVHGDYLVGGRQSGRDAPPGTGASRDWWIRKAPAQGSVPHSGYRAGATCTELATIAGPPAQP
jgi:hypothetical protein